MKVEWGECWVSGWGLFQGIFRREHGHPLSAFCRRLSSASCPSLNVVASPVPGRANWLRHPPLHQSSIQHPASSIQHAIDRRKARASSFCTVAVARRNHVSVFCHDVHSFCADVLVCCNHAGTSWNAISAFWNTVNRFCDDFGPFCGHIPLFCRDLTIFCGNVPLFCDLIQLFCGQIRVFCGHIRVFWNAIPIPMNLIFNNLPLINRQPSTINH